MRCQRQTVGAMMVRSVGAMQSWQRPSGGASVLAGCDDITKLTQTKHPLKEKAELPRAYLQTDRLKYC